MTAMATEAHLASGRARALRGLAAALAAVFALSGCGDSQEFLALRAENEQLREQADEMRMQLNELRSALGEIRGRIEDLRGNLRLGSYTRYGRNLNRDLDDLAAKASELEAKSAGAEPERAEPR